MTRKKFVKQVMGMGYQRNTAEFMAMCARAVGRTYEEYLRDEIRRQSTAEALPNIHMLVDCIKPVCEAAAKVLDSVLEAFAGFNLDTVTTMLDYLMENAPQIAEQHATDALDAMVYALDPLQIIEQEPAQEWPAKNPYLAHHCQDGLRVHTVLVDELDGQGGGGRD